jgi:hypothetical protein
MDPLDHPVVEELNSIEVARYRHVVIIVATDSFYVEAFRLSCKVS